MIDSFGIDSFGRGQLSRGPQLAGRQGREEQIAPITPEAETNERCLVKWDGEGRVGAARRNVPRSEPGPPGAGSQATEPSMLRDISRNAVGLRLPHDTVRSGHWVEVPGPLAATGGACRMDVFSVREQLVEDYRSFTSGFVEVRDPLIRAFVGRQLAEGVQWPDPWLSLNPSFETGGTVADLVAEGLLHPECERIFRRQGGPDDPGSAVADVPPAPARGDRGRPRRRLLRPDHRDGFGQVAGLHRPDRRPGPAGTGGGDRAGAAVGEGDRRLPDERAGQLAARGAGEVPAVRLPRQVASRSRSPATPARRTTRSAGGSWPSRRTSC